MAMAQIKRLEPHEHPDADPYVLVCHGISGEVARHGAGGRGRTFYTGKEQDPQSIIDRAVDYADANGFPTVFVKD
jgi:hypothetical protein